MVAECLPLVSLRAVSKSYDVGGGNTVRALGPVDLDLFRGELITIVGANAAGKTTLFRALCGEIDFEGEILFVAGDEQRPLTPAERGSRIAHVTQVPLEGTVAGLSIAENAVLFAKRGQRLSWWRRGVTKDRTARLKEYLRSFGLDLTTQLTDPIEAVSGGQAQLLGMLLACASDELARGSGSSPDLILLDEPTSALDPENARRCTELIELIHRERAAAVMMITHDHELALRLGRRMIVLRGGRVLYDGPTDALDVSGLALMSSGLDEPAALARSR